MSFALEYRKKMQAEAREAEAGKKTTRKPRPARSRRARTKKSAPPPAMAPADFVVGAAKKSTDTRGNRLRVLAALSLAGGILSVFNSGALVQYAGGLGYNQAAMRVIIASENWHALMEQSRMTALVDGIREAVTTARHSEWQDLAFGLELKPTHPYLQDLQEPDTAREDSARPAGQPERPQSASPVMRADVTR